MTVFSYLINDLDSLDNLIRDNAAIAELLVNSMIRQVFELLQIRILLKEESGLMYSMVNKLHDQYKSLCLAYSAASKKLPILSTVTEFSQADMVEDWLHGYYCEIRDMDPAAREGFFHGKTAISSGFLRKGVEDVLLIMQSCKQYQEYINDIIKVYSSNEGPDLFSLISNLHYDTINIRGADAAVESLMAELSGVLSNLKCVSLDYYYECLNQYNEKLAAKRLLKVTTDIPVATGIKQNLLDSLEVILEYSDCNEEMFENFSRSIKDFINLPDRDASDDTATSLRREVATAFYTIYKLVLMKSFDDPSLTTIIKMFLSFGYVDAELAGRENADFLYSIADSFKGNSDMGYYTLHEWFAAIYKGEKEPSRSELDQDYPAFVRQLKKDGKIDAKEETRLLSDTKMKVQFELENVFPSVNKITFGRIATFNPLFSENNLQRKLEGILITPELLRDTFKDILKIDYSAFYREKVYSNPACNILNEPLHIEILPEVILMPIVGIRGVMWQEICGKNRATPSRMFLPVFLQTELQTLLLRLTGDFRWEMCRRVQGPHWNDLSDPSLTSEFCDYLQFYKNNSELSANAKETIKIELIRMKNSYKNVFISYYIDWMLYESNALPRLNKSVRKMMLDYCTFPAEIREKLSQNPQFIDLFTRFNLKRQKRIRQITNIIQKVNRSAKKVPQELLDELEFAER
jgi:hypothetical protein